MKAKALVLGLVGLAVLLLPQVSHAQCNLNIAVIPDGRVQAYTIIFGADTDTNFLFDARAGRSYHVDVQTNGSFFNDISGNINAGSCPVTNHASFRTTENVDPSSGICCGGNSLRGSFTATATTNHAVRVSASSVNVSVLVKIVETTLFSPGWSTGGGFNTFYSLQNTTGATCNVTLKLFNAAGTELATTTQAVLAGALLATNTSALGVGAGQFGTARLTHDCPPGGILPDAAIANFGTSPAAIIPAKFAPRE
jgi:hypothetical protein